ncbi:uncharacterized protein RB166_016736 [Leptodactylus fuscus]
MDTANRIVLWLDQFARKCVSPLVNLFRQARANEEDDQNGPREDGEAHQREDNQIGQVEVAIGHASRGEDDTSSNWFLRLLKLCGAGTPLGSLYRVPPQYNAV